MSDAAVASLGPAWPGLLYTGRIQVTNLDSASPPSRAHCTGGGRSPFGDRADRSDYYPAAVHSWSLHISDPESPARSLMVDAKGAGFHGVPSKRPESARRPSSSAVTP